MKRKLLCLLMVFALLMSIPIPGYAAAEMKVSDDCMAVIKAFEGFSGKPYRDTDGHYTIGYGTRCPADKVEYYTKNPMSEEEADAQLRLEMATYEKAVNSFMDTHGLSYNQGQFDGVISLVFNCGTAWLTKGETLIKALTQGYTGNDLIYAFTIYSMNGGNRSIGHVNRRLAEANMYLNAAYNRKPPEHYSYVLYDGNGGKVSTYNVQGYDVNAPVATIPTATYEGKTFRGWYTKASGGIQVTKLDASTAGMTLYAHWGNDSDTVPEDRPSIIVPDANVSKITGSLVPGGTAVDPVKVTVTGSSVNLRKGPGTRYKVVGSAEKGAIYTVTAIHQDATYLWGCYGNGWICLDYTDYQKKDTETPPQEKPETPPQTEPESPPQTEPETDTITKTYATVKDNETLNVRTEPDGKIITSLPAGTRVEILEQKTVANRLWGRYSGGWICLKSLVNLETVTLVPVTITKTYATVKNNETLNVRTEPDGKIITSLPAGTRVEILEKKTVANRLWGRYSGGWICLKSLVTLETVTQVSYQEQQSRQTRSAAMQVKSGYVTAYSLNVRIAPGVNNRAVAWLNQGDMVQILQYASVGGKLWGRTAKGWISLRYVKMA